jgi:membrane protease YdiL (CAAX protease family)
VCFYLATFFVLTWLRFPFVYWSGLISACVATAASIAILERGRWALGIFVPARVAIREFLLGSGWGVFLIGGAAMLIVLTTNLRHADGPGFPWRELGTTFLPAAVHEELVFRGYVFQKWTTWRRSFAVFAGAVLFAALHLGNPSIGRLALLNIFLGGILLGLAYLAYERLWFPIGLHLSWNLMSGPILGHEVSGYEALRTMLVTRDPGPVWLTGGPFGLEASVWATVAELVAIALLARKAYHPASRISPPGDGV